MLVSKAYVREKPARKIALQGSGFLHFWYLKLFGDNNIFSKSFQIFFVWNLHGFSLVFGEDDAGARNP